MVEDLLKSVKENLIITHDEDDNLIRGYIRESLDYASSVQKIDYETEPLPPAAKRAVIMLSSHYYESRDGSAAGFLSGQASGARQVWDAVNRLLLVGKRWDV